MKILYVANQYSPFDHDQGSGEDYNMYHGFLAEGAQIEVVGPFKKDQPSFVERVYRKFHRLFSKMRPAKFSLAYLNHTGRAVSAAAARYQPDVVFSHFLAPLVRARFDAPLAYFCDAGLQEWNDQWPIFSWLEMQRMLGWERAVVLRSDHIFTRSTWVVDSLVRRFHISPEKMQIVPMVAALPDEVVPKSISSDPPDFSTLRLLFVGKDFKLKGGDIAVQVAGLLNAAGVRTELRVVGCDGQDSQHVRYMGLYKKMIPEQLREYAAQYEWAHFLIHPARFEAAGIVTAEAAAFGVPTLTNDRGGLGTTVRDGVSGVVLPGLSEAPAYVRVIQEFLANPQRYQQLRQTSRKRYEEEMNWPVVRKILMKAMQELVERRK